MRITFKAAVCGFSGIVILINIFLVEYIVSYFADNQILNEEISSSLNYNNISAGYSSYWVADNKVYVSDSIGFLCSYYEITNKGKKRITLVDGPSSYGLQTYEDKVYIYDIHGEKVRIREFSISTGIETSTIIANKAEIILQCFIVDEYAYILTCEDSSKTLTKVSLKTKLFDVVCSNVTGVGVMNGSVVYLTEKDNVYNVFKYDKETVSSTCIGEFSSDIYTSGLFVDCNFTSNRIILFDADYNENTTRILTYNIENNSLKDDNIDFIISSMIASENNAFCVATTEFHDENSYKDKNALYKMDINSLTFEKLDDIDGIVELFVTSDNDVFVEASSFDGLRHYKGDGQFTQAIKLK